MQNLKLFPAMFQKKLFFRLPQCNEDMRLYEGSETPFFEIKIMFWVQVWLTMIWLPKKIHFMIKQ